MRLVYRQILFNSLASVKNAHGDKMCGNKEHIAKGAKLVFVTEDDNRILTVTNPSTVAVHQGQHVQIKGATDSEKSTITVQQVKVLK